MDTPIFGKPATYSGERRIEVDTYVEGRNWRSTVLRLIESKGKGWAIYLPPISNRTEYKPGFYISGYKPLREAKRLAQALVEAAPDFESILALRGATELPAWAAHLKPSQEKPDA